MNPEFIVGSSVADSMARSSEPVEAEIEIPFFKFFLLWGATCSPPQISISINFSNFFFLFLGGETYPNGAIRPQKWRSLPFYHMRRSSRNGLIAIRPTAASHTLLAKCQSCGIRTAKITWSRGSTGSSFTCEHTSRGIFPHDLFSLLESLGSLEMWRILRISLVTKLKSAKTKVLEIGNQSYFLGKKACH